MASDGCVAAAFYTHDVHAHGVGAEPVGARRELGYIRLGAWSLLGVSGLLAFSVASS